ncbi:gamma-glutamyl-gamma-aminobutyrate hydrolase family protein [uncultured Gemella sp.]|uniref:gamma-glutamyl-gamma-aminobutyrate hydrolase family protein n=1 Tax=uncultured Gemella sp. TaxID=254352 RepID=UPI0025DF00D7|nr:gamma-glutamyl-gamma-aminobutyrate hydrolase family protein [uncultured Gemella sp.]
MKIIAISTRSVDYKSDAGIAKRRLYINGYFSEIAEKAGFILFPVCSDNGLEEIAAMCSGLIIAGRDRDINPKYYGEEPLEGLEYPEDLYEDELDFRLIELFEKSNKPILGICSGLQSLNIYHGGTLKQHIDEHTSKEQLVRHNIDIEEDSFVHSLYGSKTEVNSIHHQAINKVADGFKVTAVAEDGNIEAIEKGNLIGVQWHPEVDYEIDTFKKFLDLCE